MSQKQPSILSATLLLAAAIAMSGCASGKMLRRGDALSRQGDWDAAIAQYQEVLNENPDNQEARSKLVMARTNAALFHRQEGLKQHRVGDLKRAQLELELSVRLDPTNEAAAIDLRNVSEELEDVERDRRSRRTSLEDAVESARTAASPTPMLEPRTTGAMTFDYRRATLKEIYRAMGRLAGINVLFDPDVDNEETSFFLENTPFEQALAIITLTYGHFYRVMSSNTILIAPDNQNKRRQYTTQVMRTFYLSNAQAEVVANTLRTILQARLVAEDPELNVVTIRDTPEVVELAERIIGSIDKARGEVLLDVEIFEVNRALLDQYGLSLSSFATVASVSQTDVGLALKDLGNITQQDVFITVPSLRYQFLRENTDFKLIANPQLRASDGQLSSMLVGEQRPVVSTTFNPQNTSGGDVIPISTTEYRDVGIRISATPRVHHNNQVTLQLEIEVSSVIGETGPQQLPIFSTRSLQTTLRLLEGETNLLAGLLRDDERTVLRGIPVLSSIPLLRNIFTSTEKQVSQNDIVLAITPHIIRMADIRAEDLETVYVGTEANVGGGSTGGGRGSSRGRGQNNQGDRAGGVDPVDPVDISITPAILTATVGQRFSVQINLSGSAEINNAGLRISYNAVALRFIEATEGSVLSSDGARTSFQAVGGQQGSVAIGIGRVGDGGGVLASGTLATLTFEAIAAGESDIRFASSVLRNSEGRPIPVSPSPSRVRVSGTP